MATLVDDQYIKLNPDNEWVQFGGYLADKGRYLADKAKAVVNALNNDGPDAYGSGNSRYGYHPQSPIVTQPSTTTSPSADKITVSQPTSVSTPASAINTSSRLNPAAFAPVAQNRQAIPTKKDTTSVATPGIAQPALQNPAIKTNGQSEYDALIARANRLLSDKAAIGPADGTLRSRYETNMAHRRIDGELKHIAGIAGLLQQKGSERLNQSHQNYYEAQADKAYAEAKYEKMRPLFDVAGLQIKNGQLVVDQGRLAVERQKLAYDQDKKDLDDFQKMVKSNAEWALGSSDPGEDRYEQVANFAKGKAIKDRGLGFSVNTKDGTEYVIPHALAKNSNVAPIYNKLYAGQNNPDSISSLLKAALKNKLVYGYNPSRFSQPHTKKDDIDELLAQVNR